MTSSISDPKISVLMPAYNAEKYIRQAIKSVLDQTYKNFELIVVNDGSTDATKECILSFKDTRIVYKENEKNSGLAYTRNRLISEAKGEYYAWLDADDVYHATMLEKQYIFLTTETSCDVVTTWARVIDGEDMPTGSYFKSYAPPAQLPVVFLFVNYIVQSSVMARKSIFKEFAFDEHFPVILDFEIWTRIADKYTITILKEVLVDYRMHTSNMSIVDGDKAIKAMHLFYKRRFNLFDIDASDENIALQYDVSFGTHTTDMKQLDKIEVWLINLRANTQLNNRFGKKSLNEVLAHRWVKACFRDKRIGYKAIGKCMSSSLFRFNIRNMALVAQYAVKSA